MPESGRWMLRLLLLAFVAGAALADVDSAEKDALTDLYYQTDGQSWAGQSGWPGSTNPTPDACTWSFVTCSSGSPQSVLYVRLLRPQSNQPYYLHVDGVLPTVWPVCY